MDFVNPFKEGDILVSSWGYDQTNVDFYQVTKVLKKSVKIRKISSKMLPAGEGYSSMSGMVVAVKDGFIEDSKEQLKRVSGFNGGGYVSLSSYSGAYKWDGKPEYCSWYA